MSIRPTPIVMFEDEAHAEVALKALHRLRSDLDIIDIMDLKPDRSSDSERFTWIVRIPAGRQLTVSWRTEPTLVEDYVRIVSFDPSGTSFEFRIHDGAPDGWKVLDWLETVSMEAVAMIKGARNRDVPGIVDAVASDYARRHGSRRVHVLLPSPWSEGAVDAEPGKGPSSSDADPITRSDMALLPKALGVHTRTEAGGRGRIHCVLSIVEREYDRFDTIAALRLAAVLEAARKDR